VAEDFVTFDEKLDRLLEIKRRLSQDMLNGCSDVGPSDFSDLKNCEGSTLLDVLPEGPFRLQTHFEAPGSRQIHHLAAISGVFVRLPVIFRVTGWPHARAGRALSGWPA
jgi:hypothetical protein